MKQIKKAEIKNLDQLQQYDPRQNFEIEDIPFEENEKAQALIVLQFHRLPGLSLFFSISLF